MNANILVHNADNNLPITIGKMLSEAGFKTVIKEHAVIVRPAIFIWCGTRGKPEIQAKEHRAYSISHRQLYWRGCTIQKISQEAKPNSDRLTCSKASSASQSRANLSTFPFRLVQLINQSTLEKFLYTCNSECLQISTSASK